MQAAGKVENTATHLIRSFATDAQGNFSVGGLPWGRYRLEISRNGFATHSELMDVQSGAPVVRVVTMALAQAESRVEVVATTPLAGTDLAPDQIAGPVQTATAADVEKSGALELGDF